MSVGARIGRFRLVERISVRKPPASDSAFRSYPVESWLGHDEKLDRPVSIRLLRTDDARIASVLGAARAAALVDDPRLMRVLDVIPMDGESSEAPRTAIISEWAEGQSLVDHLETSGPATAAAALMVVGDVASALALALDQGVPHGRLSPTTVFLTEGGEVRVRGLAVDAALFGPLDSDSRSGRVVNDDVDGLGSLLYALVTGYWPDPSVDPAEVGIPLAPLTGRSVPLPSRVRAQVPRPIDEVVGRSVLSISRPRGSIRIADASGFATAATAALDRLTPLVPTSLRIARPQVTTGRRITRTVGILAAVGIVILTFAAGMTLLTAGSGNAEEIAAATEATDLLTSEAVPFAEEFAFSAAQVPVSILSVRSYDPFSDDDENGKPDKRKGRENEESALLAIDVDPATEWVTETYATADADGKGGVGLIIDLGQPMNISAVTLNLRGYGTDVQVKVADEIQKEPDLWTPFVDVEKVGPEIELRSPRPVRGQYVLVWLDSLPSEPGGTGRYTGGIGQIQVFATPDEEPAA
jgi:hypothetical protein